MIFFKLFINPEMKLRDYKRCSFSSNTKFSGTISRKQNAFLKGILACCWTTQWDQVHTTQLWKSSGGSSVHSTQLWIFKLWCLTHAWLSVNRRGHTSKEEEELLTCLFYVRIHTIHLFYLAVFSGRQTMFWQENTGEEWHGKCTGPDLCVPKTDDPEKRGAEVVCALIFCESTKTNKQKKNQHFRSIPAVRLDAIISTHQYVCSSIPTCKHCRHCVILMHVHAQIHVNTKPLCFKERLADEARHMITSHQFLTETWGSLKKHKRQHRLSWHVCRGAPGVHVRTPVHMAHQWHHDPWRPKVWIALQKNKLRALLNGGVLRGVCVSWGSGSECLFVLVGYITWSCTHTHTCTPTQTEHTYHQLKDTVAPLPDRNQVLPFT